MQRYNFDNGRKVELLKKYLPHICIILSVALIVFIVIDVFFNSAMGFVNNNGTKFIMLILCVLTITNSVLCVIDNEEKNKVIDENKEEDEKSEIL